MASQGIKFSKHAQPRRSILSERYKLAYKSREDCKQLTKLEIELCRRWSTQADAVSDIKKVNNSAIADAELRAVSRPIDTCIISGLTLNRASTPPGIDALAAHGKGTAIMLRTWMPAGVSMLLTKRLSSAAPWITKGALPRYTLPNSEDAPAARLPLYDSISVNANQSVAAGRRR